MKRYYDILVNSEETMFEKSHVIIFVELVVGVLIMIDSEG